MSEKINPESLSKAEIKTGSFDDVITDLRKEAKESTTIEAEKSVEKEKLLKEKVKILRQELEKLNEEERFLEGGMTYYAIKDDEKGFSVWLKEKRELIVKLNQLKYSENELYREAGYPTFVLEKPTKEKLEEDWRKADDAAKPLDTYKQFYHAEKILRRNVMKGRHPAKVENIVDVLAHYRKEELRYGPYSHVGGEEKPIETPQIIDERLRFDKFAEGIGMAALKSGDLEVSAESLAFAQSIKDISETTVAIMKDELAKLSEEKKVLFIKNFDGARKKFQTRNPS